MLLGTGGVDGRESCGGAVQHPRKVLELAGSQGLIKVGNDVVDMLKPD